MSDQEDTLRSRKQYREREEKQIKQQGADELAQPGAGEDARDNPKQQQKNRERMDVGPDHKTKKMRKENRGTFP